MQANLKIDFSRYRGTRRFETWKPFDGNLGLS